MQAYMAYERNTNFLFPSIINGRITGTVDTADYIYGGRCASRVGGAHSSAIARMIHDGANAWRMTHCNWPMIPQQLERYLILVFAFNLPPPFCQTVACAKQKPSETACHTGGAHCHWSLTLTIASTDLSQIGSSRISKNAKILRQNSIQPPVSCAFKAIRLNLSQY
jgi:hypothetical protein